ncbi:sigma factor [Tistrella mobilis]|uniref:RNA polymerase sigma factor n=1 Tax=Tistrella mobilis TaxID=171437 RepID=UPI0035580759
MTGPDAAHRAVEAAARHSRARLVAFLAARFRDLAAAEDAVADAFRIALDLWPRQGVPQAPEAWLATVARRRITRGLRHGAVRRAAEPALTLLAGEAEDAAMAARPLPDDRLALLFVCAHPAIAPEMRAPLMLQAVLGLDAARIGSAFLVAPATMGQRLVRAKARIRSAGIGFQLPEPQDLPERLSHVLDAVYAAFGTGWEMVAGGDTRGADLTGEALWLGRLLVELMPDAAEARGLLALMAHCEARRPARRDTAGRYVPIDLQDTTLWRADLIAEAEAQLTAAAALGRPGRYQLEAAIQSAHNARADPAGRPQPGPDIRLALYNALMAIAPSAGAAVGHAAALAGTAGPMHGLHALDAVAGLETYQPAWALRAHLLAASGDAASARAAYARAIGLAEDPAVRSWLAAAAAGINDGA